MLRFLQRLMASSFWMRAFGALSSSLRLWHPDVKRDPYPTYRWFRERRLVRMRLFGGYAVPRYADVERVLREPEFSTNRDALALVKALRRSTRGAPDFRALVDNNLLMIDGAQHRRVGGRGREYLNRDVRCRRLHAVGVAGERAEAGGRGIGEPGHGDRGRRCVHDHLARARAERRAAAGAPLDAGRCDRARA